MLWEKSREGAGVCVGGLQRWSRAGTWGSVPGRRHGESTGPEVRVCPVHARKSEEAGVVRAEWGEGVSSHMALRPPSAA